VKAFLQRMNIPPAHYEVLLGKAEECLAGCREVAHDGTVIFRPDGSGHYNGMWTRDFCYMVEGAGQLMDRDEALAAIDYLLAAQREDGVIPDRVQGDGLAVYCAGPVDDPIGAIPPTDNAPFMVKTVAAYTKLTRDYDAFLDRRAALYKAMATVPLTHDRLVSVDPNRPHASYGFTDCVAKTGNVFFSTMLYWEACQTLAKLCADCEYHDEAHDWYEQAEKTWQRIDDFWDDSYGMYKAASEHGRQIDLWGSAYACVVRVASKKHATRIAGYFLDLMDECLLHGHLRHLPAGQYWRRMLVDVPEDTYQNGGFWSVPSGWLIQTLNLEDPDAAQQIVADLVEEFDAHGVHEWINREQRHLPGYVASITNVLGAVQSSKKLA